MQDNNPFDFSIDAQSMSLDEAVEKTPETIVRTAIKVFENSKIGKINGATDKAFAWVGEALSSMQNKIPITDPNRAKVEDLVAKFQVLEEILMKSNGKFTDEARRLVTDIRFAATQAMIM